jgi:PST family polysaccharide transporter
MTRHVLFPAGEAHAAMWATLIGTAVGVPAMLLLAGTVGPAGVALGYAATELIATAVLVRRTGRTIRRLDEAAPIR